MEREEAHRAKPCRCERSGAGRAVPEGKPDGPPSTRSVCGRMSGKAVGWVIQHGPKSRALRLVLLLIADAANQHGENSHPGLDALIEGSLYGRSTILAALHKLERDGWVDVQERRRRGHATVFRIPGVAAAGQPYEVQKPDLVAAFDNAPNEVPGLDLNGPSTRSEDWTSTEQMRSNPGTSTGAMRSNLRTNEVQFSKNAPYNATEVPTVLATAATAAGSPLRSDPAQDDQNGTARRPTDDPLKAVAHRLAVLAHEQPVKPITRGGFHAVMARLEQALRAGVTETDLGRAIRAGPVTWTADGLTTAIAINQPDRAHRTRSTADTAMRMIRNGPKPR